MSTRRTNCAYCGKRLKMKAPLAGILSDRYATCRKCGRDQPPGTAWTDLGAELRGLRSELRGAGPSVPPPAPAWLTPLPAPPPTPARPVDRSGLLTLVGFIVLVGAAGLVVLLVVSNVFLT